MRSSSSEKLCRLCVNILLYSAETIRIVSTYSEFLTFMEAKGYEIKNAEFGENSRKLNGYVHDLYQYVLSVHRSIFPPVSDPQVLCQSDGLLHRKLHQGKMPESDGKKGMKYNEWAANKSESSKKAQLRKDINQTILSTESWWNG